MSASCQDESIDTYNVKAENDLMEFHTLEGGRWPSCCMSISPRAINLKHKLTTAYNCLWVCCVQPTTHHFVCEVPICIIPLLYQLLEESQM
jgi:hypothetical protein